MHILQGHDNYLLDNQKVCAGICLQWALQCHLALPMTSPIPNPLVIPAHPTEPSSSSKGLLKAWWMAPGASKGAWAGWAASLGIGVQISEPSRDVGCHLCWYPCRPGSGTALASGGWGHKVLCSEIDSDTLNKGRVKQRAWCTIWRC